MSQQNHNQQTNYELRVLGNRPYKTKFDPDLAGRVNEEVEKQERLEELRRKREAKKGKSVTQTSEEQIETPELIKEPIILTITNPEDYVLLPGKTHRSYSYPDLYVSMYRLGMSTEVEQAIQQLGFQVSNTTKESNGRDYIGNINWQQALKLNLASGGLTLSPRQFADFLLLLKSGKVVDGNGKFVLKQKLDEILDEITGKREPWRAEWLDADFKYLDKKGTPVSENDSNGEFYIYSSHIFDVNRTLTPTFKKRLEPCLTEDVKISLNSMNEQGLPTKRGNDFDYWFPRKHNNSIAGFGAGSGGACFGCLRIPGNWGASLGVRLCVPKAHAKNL